MSNDLIISTTKRELIRAFATLDSWFDREDNYSFQGNTWSTRELLSHSMYMNKHILSFVNKTIGKSKNPAYIAEPVFTDGLFDNEFYAISAEGSTDALPNAEEICGELRWQLYECLSQLDEIKRFSKCANSEEKSDYARVFYCIYFLVQQLKQHIELGQRTQKKWMEQLH